MAPAAAPTGLAPVGAPPRKPLVYMAGPYTNPDPVHNTRRAIRCGIHVRRAGLVAVLIPHLTLLADLVEPHGCDYWYEFDLDQVACCDAVVRLPGTSTGADREHAYAESLGIPVFEWVSGLPVDFFQWRDGWTP